MPSSPNVPDKSANVKGIADQTFRELSLHDISLTQEILLIYLLMAIILRVGIT